MPPNNNNTHNNGTNNHKSPAERFRRNLSLNNPSSTDVTNQQSAGLGSGNILINKNYNTVDNNITSPYRKLIQA